MSGDRYRMILIGLGLSLAALVAVVIALQPSGDPAALPAPLERVFPAPGDAVVRQTVIEVDLPVGYSIDLIVDGVTVPPAEIGLTPATGVAIWQPAPGRTIAEWAPGPHVVEVRWDRTSGGRPDPGSFEWSFRVR